MCNIGVHLFDMLLFVFGAFARNEMRGASETRASGVLELANARVEWLLSVESDDLAAHRVENTQDAEIVESSAQNVENTRGNTKNVRGAGFVDSMDSGAAGIDSGAQNPRDMDFLDSGRTGVKALDSASALDFASTSKSANLARTDSHQPPAKKALRILESIPQDSTSTRDSASTSAPKALNAQDKAPNPPSTTPRDMSEPLSFDFSQGFEDLHTKSYQEILAGMGFGLDDIRACIALIEHISSQINHINPD